MEAALFLQRIDEEFPDIQWKTYRYITRGWDHVVLILDDQIVFRAPKNSEYKEEFANEIALLEYLNKKVSVRIPEYVYVARDQSFAGYPLVKGEELTPSRFTLLSVPEKELIARQLAEFIATLHATPRSLIHTYGVRIDDQYALCKELQDDVENLLYTRMNKKEIILIEDFFTELMATLNHSYPKALVHNDLGSEHIFWDVRENQIGIIDFSDRSLGDPAIDFTGLFEYGPRFQKHVYELYEGHKDERMYCRSYLYYKRVPLYFMVDALQGYPCSYDEGYTLFNHLFKESDASFSVHV
jgi:aminoglycoside 2''-phosphotransferase